MRKIRYSKDVDALLVELSSEPVDHAEESGQFIVHFSQMGGPVLLEILDAKNSSWVLCPACSRRRKRFCYECYGGLR